MTLEEKVKEIMGEVKLELIKGTIAEKDAKLEVGKRVVRELRAQEIIMSVDLTESEGGEGCHWEFKGMIHLYTVTLVGKEEA